MSDISAYDLGRFQRLVGVDGRRVSGTFMVLSAKDSPQMWVTTVDVVVWDEGHNSGRVLHSQDLTASVQDGEADLRERSIASNKLDDVLDAWDEMKAALVAAAQAATFAAPAVSHPEPTEEANLSEILTSSTEVKDHSDADVILAAADWLESIRYEQWNGSTRRPNNYHRAAEDLRRHARQMAERGQQ